MTLNLKFPYFLFSQHFHEMAINRTLKPNKRKLQPYSRKETWSDQSNGDHKVSHFGTKPQPTNRCRRWLIKNGLIERRTGFVTRTTLMNERLSNELSWVVSLFPSLKRVRTTAFRFSLSFLLQHGRV